MVLKCYINAYILHHILVPRLMTSIESGIMIKLNRNLEESQILMNMLDVERKLLKENDSFAKCVEALQCD